MEAKEMFEKLGYRYMKSLSNKEHIWYRNSRTKSEIVFNLIGKSISNDYAITLEELQAINKQVEELGWNER